MSLKKKVLQDPVVKKEYDKLEEEFKTHDETAYLLRSSNNARHLLESIAELEQGRSQERELLE